jgi:hypothetical protein
MFAKPQKESPSPQTGSHVANSQKVFIQVQESKIIRELNVN